MPDLVNAPRGWSLRWPRDLFRMELEAVLQLDRPNLRGGLRALFAEALLGPDPVEELEQVPDPRPVRHNVFDDPWDGSAPQGPDELANFGAHVLANVHWLPTYTPRRYYTERVQDQRRLEVGGAAARATDPLPLPVLEARWEQLLNGLIDLGYLDRRAGDACEDGQGREGRFKRIAELVEQEGKTERWSTHLEDRSYGSGADHDFYTLVEVFHDLVARPRVRVWHDHDGAYCWSQTFDEAIGQAIYRWQVNLLLAEANVELRLADDGEDRGYLVAAASEPLRELVLRARADAPETDQARVDHAVATFRRRGASVEEKRSACEALASVLEHRDRLIRRKLNSTDEKDLSRIANQFGIRHHNAKQRTDYAEAYLDWVFWCFLAAVELTNVLLVREDAL